MKERLFKKHIREYGPHFDEAHAMKAVSHMRNEDGTKGEHFTIEQAHKLAEQYGVTFKGDFNKYDWYVALNMIYSDFYRVVVTLTGSNNPKCFVELAKAWLNDKDVEEGKMWYYYSFVICDKLRECFEDEDDDEDDMYYTRNRTAKYRHAKIHYDGYDDDDDDDIYESHNRRRMRMSRY